MFNNCFYSITRALVTLFILCLLVGCGGGGGGTTATNTSTESASSITGMGWYFENSALDYYNNGSTCTLKVFLYYSESITTDDIESVSVTAPNGSRWSIALSNSPFGTSSTGKPYIIGSLLYSDNPNAFPLAGIWTVEITLKEGKTLSFQRTLHEPGSTDDATHQYLYTKEDWAPSTNPSQYIAALSRFPSQGYTVQYSADDGGSITTTGFSAVRSSFLAAEPRAYNMYCWLYDANYTYLGRTNPEYSTLDHSSTNLITADGEIFIVPASTISSAGSGYVDLSKVKYIRFVNTDGAQYAPSSYSSIDYRSISSLVALN
ncbi:MAG: hypothetical protein ABSA71_17630 [Desulfomonilia bacterium]|jgi:hypothetical protein